MISSATNRCIISRYDNVTHSNAFVSLRWPERSQQVLVVMKISAANTSIDFQRNHEQMAEATDICLNFCPACSHPISQDHDGNTRRPVDNTKSAPRERRPGAGLCPYCAAALLSIHEALCSARLCEDENLHTVSFVTLR